jgi:acetyltransferase-like isoleucine patch superfamily enzyme
MNDEEIALDADLDRLWLQLRALHVKLRNQTWLKYKRANPFIEDLFDWREKGEFIGGRDVTIYDSTTIVGDVKIGDHTWVGPFCSLDGTGGLSIGNHCSIAAGTHILTHDTVAFSLSGGKLPYEYAPVVIGDCCFIGVNSVVTRGVTIADHCLVAAGAVVTQDVPPMSIVAGVPAKVIGRVELRDDTVTLRIDE